MEASQPSSEPSEQNLEEVYEEARARIVAVGCGGAGGNTISRMMEVGIEGAETLALNTDAQDLLYATADQKLLIGRECTGGLGAGNDPSKGEEAARENEDEIKDHLHGSDLVFITCGLGGGTGTGSAPVVAEVAKRMDALTVGVVTLPFSVEGKRRSRNAEKGLKELREVSDTVIVIPNDKLLEVAPDLPIPAAFKVADQLLMDSIKGVTELIAKPGLINLDFADVRTVLEDGGVAMIGIGESDTEERAEESVEEALNSPLLDVDVTGARGALVNVTGSPDMSLDEAEGIVGRVSEALDPEAPISWGAQVSDDMKKAVKVMVILSGVHSPYVLSSGEEPTGDRIRKTPTEEEEEEFELGLEPLE